MLNHKTTRITKENDSVNRPSLIARLKTIIERKHCMIKNKLYLLVALPLVIVLGACASIAGIQIPGLTTNSTQASQNQTSANFNPSQMSLKQKLAIGTLKLESTDLAVTAKEANDLLPLWKAVKSLSASDTAAPAEIQALYKQIEGVMTSEQTQAIQKMTWTQDDMQALMTQYGVQFGNGQGQSSQTLTADQQATRTALQMSSRIRNSGGGGFPGGGGPPAGGAGGSPGGGPPAGGVFPGGPGGFGDQGMSTTGTPQPGQANRSGGMGMNSMFVDPLIKLLQTRAAGQ
jgi:hypothetical protein